MLDLCEKPLHGKAKRVRRPHRTQARKFVYFPRREIVDNDENTMQLIIAFWAASIALTGITYYFSGLYQQWYWFWTIPLFLYAYFLVCFATWIIFLFVAGLFVKEDETYVYPPNRFAQWTVKQTCRVILFLLGARTHITGLGKVPKGKPIILINNHLSVFDEMAIAAFFPGHFVFVTKPGNFDIPIAGPWMRYAGYIPIKQGDIADGTRVIALCADYINHKNVSICIAPEGTRNKTFPDPVLLPFHPGTFNLAKDTGAPVVCMAIQNTNAIFKRFPRHQTHIYLDVVGVLEEEEYADMTARQICDRARDLVLRRLTHKDARFYHLKPKKNKKGKEDGEEESEE